MTTNVSEAKQDNLYLKEKFLPLFSSRRSLRWLEFPHCLCPGRASSRLCKGQGENKEEKIMSKCHFIDKNNIAASKSLCNVSIYLEVPVLSGEFM